MAAKTVGNVGGLPKLKVYALKFGIHVETAPAIMEIPQLESQGRSWGGGLYCCCWYGSLTA